MRYLWNMTTRVTDYTSEIRWQSVCTIKYGVTRMKKGTYSFPESLYNISWRTPLPTIAYCALLAETMQSLGAYHGVRGKCKCAGVINAPIWIRLLPASAFNQHHRITSTKTQKPGCRRTVLVGVVSLVGITEHSYIGCHNKHKVQTRCLVTTRRYSRSGSGWLASFILVVDRSSLHSATIRPVTGAEEMSQWDAAES